MFNNTVHADHNSACVCISVCACLRVSMYVCERLCVREEGEGGTCVRACVCVRVCVRAHVSYL